MALRRGLAKNALSLTVVQRTHIDSVDSKENLLNPRGYHQGGIEDLMYPNVHDTTIQIRRDHKRSKKTNTKERN